jgi:putative DNA primase/helicase
MFEPSERPIARLPQWIEDISQPETSSTSSPSSSTGSSMFVDPEIARDLRSALNALPADDRELWIRMGHALKDFGNVGHALWMDWSMQSAKFEPRASAVAWDSFKPQNITYLSVFHEAEQRGWLNPKSKLAVQTLHAWIDWPEPTSLPTLPPVQPFHEDLMPVALRRGVMDTSHRMQCPPDFPAVTTVLALSSLVAAYAVVQPKARDDWQIVPNLWGMSVGRPGVKKSPALNESLKPLKHLQSIESERWQMEITAWELECKTALDTKLDPPDPSTKPIERRFIVNDATVEKMGEILRQNPGGTLVYRDELYGFLTSLDKQGQEGSRTFYMTGFDGNQDYTFDRIGRGTVRVPRVCISMIGGIQPGRVQDYVRSAVAGGSADDGLLQRFSLTVWPDVAAKYEHVDQYPDAMARQAAAGVFNRLTQIPPGCESAPQIWRFDQDAQAMYADWSVSFESDIRGDDLHPAIASHLAKYRKTIPALALVFALIDTPDSGGLIGEAELERALLWCDYLRSHAVRLYSAATAPETAGAAALLKRIEAGVLGAMFTPRQVAGKGWTGLNTPELAQKAANVLADFDWLRFDRQVSGDPKGRGRPSERYFVNPAVWNATRKT